MYKHLMIKRLEFCTAPMFTMLISYLKFNWHFFDGLAPVRKRFNQIMPMLLATMLSMPAGVIAQSTDQKLSGFSKKRILIVYLSRTHNTEAIAKLIEKQTGGLMVGLELERPYPENYQSIVAQVAQENESGYLPQLKTRVDNIGQYDIVFVGFPTWGMQLPPPIKSFLHQYDLKGKTVIPFNSNAGYGIGNSFQKVQELCPNSKFMDGFSTKGGVERDGVLLAIQGERANAVKDEISKWLAKLSTAIEKSNKQGGN